MLKKLMFFEMSFEWLDGPITAITLSSYLENRFYFFVAFAMYEIIALINFT